MMKTTFLALIGVLLMGCDHLRPAMSLTSQQAGSQAVQLANNKIESIFHCRPFQDGKPAHFRDGRWVWMQKRGFGYGDMEVTVELAADGSTNNVELMLLDNRNTPMRYQLGPTR